MTMHQRFRANPLGFDDYNTWMRHHEKLHAQLPLGCAKVGEEWLALWEALGELLKMPARIEVYAEWEFSAWVPMYGNTERRALGECLAKACVMRWIKRSHRVALLDGTIIKEWGTR